MLHKTKHRDQSRVDGYKSMCSDFPANSNECVMMRMWRQTAKFVRDWLLIFIQECVWRAGQCQGWWHRDINGKDVMKNFRMPTAAFNLRIYGAVSWLLVRFQDLMMYREAAKVKSILLLLRIIIWGPHLEVTQGRTEKKQNLSCSYMDLIHSQCTNLFIQMFSPALFCKCINSNKHACLIILILIS